MRVGAISGVDGVSGVSAVDPIDSGEKKTQPTTLVSRSPGQISLLVECFLLITSGKPFFTQVSRRFARFNSNDLLNPEQQEEHGRGGSDSLDWRGDQEEKALLSVTLAFLASLLNALEAIDTLHSSTKESLDLKKIPLYLHMEGLINTLILLQRGSSNTAQWMLDLKSNFKDLTIELGVHGAFSLEELLRIYAEKIYSTSLQGCILNLKV